jgi:hypothetical protein
VGGGVLGEERPTGTEERRKRRESRKEPSPRKKSRPVFMFYQFSSGGLIKFLRRRNKPPLNRTGRPHRPRRFGWGNYLKGVF